MMRDIIIGFCSILVGASLCAGIITLCVVSGLHPPKLNAAHMIGMLLAFATIIAIFALLVERYP